MALSLAANYYPAGTRPGSPIEIVDVQTFNGATEYTAGVTVSPKAQGGDIIWAQWDIGLSTNTYSASLTATPTGFLTNAGGNVATNAGPPASEVIYSTQYRVCTGTPGQQSPDAGRTIGLSWNSSLNQEAWALIVWTLRYVDSVTIFDVAGGGASSGTTPGSNGVTGSIATATNGALALGAIAANGGAAGGGLALSNLPQWYNEEDAVRTVQPNLGLIAGFADLPVAGTYLGITACAFQQPVGTNINANWVGSIVAFRPVPAPSSPAVWVLPGGTSIDAAGVAGVPFTAYLQYTPQRGQGLMRSWLLARQIHGTGAEAGYWNGDKQIWTPGEYWNYGTPPTGSTVFSYAFPASAWENDGTQWDLYGAITENQLGLKSNNAAVTLIGTFTAQSPPAVTAVTVTNPGTTTPTVNWTTNLPTGSQIGWQSRLFSDAQIATAGFSPAGFTDDVTAYPSSVTGIGNWSASVNCAVAPDAQGLKITNNSGATHDLAAVSTTQEASSLGDLSGTPVLSYGLYACTAGQQITANLWLKAASTGRTTQAKVEFWDKSGRFLSAPTGPNVTDSSSTETLATVTATAPAGAAYYALRPVILATANTEVHYLVHAAAFTAGLAPVVASPFGPGIVGNWTVSPALPVSNPGVTYTAYVRVQQFGGALSPWTNATFTDGRINAPSVSFFNGLTAAPVPAPAALTAVVGGT